MKSIELEDPIFKAYVKVFFKPKRKHIEKWLKKLNLDEDIDIDEMFPERCGGYCTWIDTNLDRINVITLYSKDLSLLVHETNHAVIGILESRGMEQDESTMETYAYYQEYLFREISEQLNLIK